MGFGQPTGGRIEGGVFFRTAGYVTDPALSAHNLQRAAEAHGSRFRFGATVAGILTEAGRVAGVRLANGEELRAPVVINVAGPGSARVNALAGVTGDMTIGTRALRQEVVHLPAPEGFDWERDGMVFSDSDIACYARPEHGNHILVGSEDPPCDPLSGWTTTPSSTATSQSSGRCRRCALPSGCRAWASPAGCAASSTSTM